MDLWLIIAPIIFIGIVVIVIKYFVDMDNTGYSAIYAPSKEEYEKRFNRVWDQIERENKAKERKEKAKRYWEGYDD